MRVIWEWLMGGWRWFVPGYCECCNRWELVFRSGSDEVGCCESCWLDSK